MANLDSILTVLGGILGVVVPILFAFALNRGVARSPFSDGQKAIYRRTVNIVTALWTTGLWALSLGSVINYHAGDRWPRIALPLFVPVIVALALLWNRTFKTIVDNSPVGALVGVQTFRLAGSVFLIIPVLGHLPQAFVSGGYGDIATGLLAICAGLMLAKKSSGAGALFVLFSLAGLLDLLNVATLLFYYYPSWSSAMPSSAALADFSLVMVPALAAPVALILHLYAIKNFFMKESSV
jgi:hypothetical protein